MRFSQANKKIFKLFQEMIKNNSTLKTEENDQLVLNFFKNTIKTPLSIYDSGWKATSMVGLGTSAEKGKMMPIYSAVAAQFDIVIPEQMLPYLKPILMVKPPPLTKVFTGRVFESSDYSGTIIRIVGDGTTLYEGSPLWPDQPQDLRIIRSSPSSISSTLKIPSSHLKAIYWVKLTYLKNGQQGVVEGELYTIARTEFIEQSCGGNWDKDTYSIAVFSRRVGDGPVNDGDSFSGILSGIGTKREVRWELDDSEFPTCADTETVFPSTPMSFSLTTPHLLTFIINGSHTFNGEPVISEWFNNHTITSNDLDEISFQSITGELVGYVPHYGPGNLSGVMGHGTLSNIYTPLNGISANTPYSSVSLLVNPDDYPTNISRLTLSLSNSGGVLFSNSNDYETMTYQKINDNTFRISYQNVIVLSASSTRETNAAFLSRNDTYFPGGGSPSLSEGTKDKKVFIESDNDVQYRLIIGFCNPLNYQEVRNYE